MGCLMCSYDLLLLVLFCKSVFAFGATEPDALDTDILGEQTCRGRTVFTIAGFIKTLKLSMNASLTKSGNRFFIGVKSILR